MKKLIIHNLQASVAGKLILKGLNLEVNAGEIHALMGPNGAGKSTLAKVLMGDPEFVVVNGEQVSENVRKKDLKLKQVSQRINSANSLKSTVSMNGQDLLAMSPNERAQAGLFLSFQNPIEIPGVRVEIFLREAHKARFLGTNQEIKGALDFRQHVTQLAADLKINSDFLKRGLNENFSGGEKKRLEILQMALLQPEFAILDETDSGLDIDALRAVALGVKKIITNYQTGVILITHYQRILKYLEPNFVHIMKAGKIVESGSKSLVEKIERDGYED